MAINSSTRFGVVYSTPKDFIEKIGSKDSTYTDGKLFVLHGDAEGALTQGIYMVEQNNTDPDGSLNIQMLSSGAYASSANAGLLDPSLYDFIRKIQDGSSNVPNADHATTAGTADIAKRVDSSLYIKVKGQNFKTYDAGDSITFDISAGNNIALSTSGNTLTITATDTTYSGNDGVVLNGTVFSHADTNTNISVDTSYGQSADASQTAKGTLTFNVPQITLDKFGHVKDVSVKTIKVLDTDVDKNWETDQSTGKVYLTGKSSNANNNVAQGYVNSSVYMQAGKVYATTGDIDASGTALVTGKAVADYVSTQLGNLSSALLYKGTVANATELNEKPKTTGHVYISSATNWDYTDINGTKYAIEIGDMFICNGTGWNIVSSEFDVSANANGTSLKVGDTVTIATVDGVDIKVALPAKGDNVYYEHPEAGKATKNFGAVSSTTNVTCGELKKIATVYDASFDASGHYVGVTPRDISINITNPNTDDKVKTSSSTSKLFIIGKTDASKDTSSAANYNASVYINKNALYSEGEKVLTSYTEQYTGTVTSITAGTGLSGGTITTDGTISLNVANSSTLGGIIASNKLNSAVTLTSSNGSTSSRYYGVQVDNTGKAFVNIPWTDYQVKASTSANKIYLIGQDDASNGTTEQAYKNASVYMQSGKMYATSGLVASNDTALVNGGTVYTAVEAAKAEAIAATIIYWETL